MKVAERKGIMIEQPAFNPDVAISFQDLYFQTMDRRRANKSYYFPENYFLALSKLPQEKLNYYQATGAYGNSLAGLIVLSSVTTAHSHLLYTTESGLKTKSTSLLYHSANLDLRKKNKEVFHLGGAAQSEAGVLEFKQRFSENRRSYTVGSLIIYHRIYERLCHMPSVESFSGDYFPAYRNMREPQGD